MDTLKTMRQDDQFRLSRSHVARAEAERGASRLESAQRHHRMRKGYRRAMGRRNYLIEGVSGTGKTSVCTELQRRGYQAIHGDRQLRYQGDPETGTPTDDRAHSPFWDVEKVKAFAASQDEAVTFFCGGSRNFAEFIALFDGVFVLEVDLDTCLRRIDERVALDPTDWGAKPEERELIARLHQSKEDIPPNGMIIDAAPPLARVVDEILRLSDANNAL